MSAALARAVSELPPVTEGTLDDREVHAAKVKKHASLPFTPEEHEQVGSRRGMSRASQRSATALSGARSSVVREDQARAMEAKQLAMELKYESKADCLQNGIRHADAKMRKAAAVELPVHCERRPVEDYVVQAYLQLLQDTEMEVRKTALERMPHLVEKGDRTAIRAILRRMWSDESWAVRLASIHSLEKVALVGDEQALLGVLARITDPEAARGGRFWVRNAARDAALKISGSEQGLAMVMDGLKTEGWEEQQQALQCMLLGAKKIPCRLDDMEDHRGPFHQGYHSPPDPKHMAQDRLSDSASKGDGDEADFKPYDEAECRRLANGYEATTHQSEIIPRRLLPTWQPPDNSGKPAHERSYEWTRGWNFTLEATGLDTAHLTELSGRHYKETVRSAYLQLKAADSTLTSSSAGANRAAAAASPSRVMSISEQHDDSWLDVVAAGKVSFSRMLFQPNMFLRAS
jgi:hypothetical protein